MRSWGLSDKNVEKALAEVRPVNNIIIIVVFSGNPGTTIIINYAPTEGSEGAIEHYETLSNTTNEIPCNYRKL